MTNTTNNTNKSKLPLYLSLSLVASIIACYFLVPDVKQFFNHSWEVLTSNDENRIKNWVENFGWFGPIALVLAMIAQMFLLVIPTVLLMVVSILAYGPIWGSIIILVAVFSASSVGYLIGNYLGETVVLKLLGETAENKMKSFINDYGFWAVFITRVNPFLSNDAISLIGGLIKMNYYKFIAATISGILPLTIFIAIIGKNTESLKSGLLWGSIGCIVAFVAYVFWDKKLR